MFFKKVFENIDDLGTPSIYQHYFHFPFIDHENHWSCNRNTRLATEKPDIALCAWFMTWPATEFFFDTLYLSVGYWKSSEAENKDLAPWHQPNPVLPQRL